MDDKQDTVALKLAAAIESGQLSPESVSIAGIAVLDHAVIEAQNAQSKQKSGTSILFQLQLIQEYLQQIDAQIAKLQTEIDSMVELRENRQEMAQQAFENFHEAEELHNDIADGVSTDERKHLVDLLGDDAIHANQDELATMLNAYIQDQQVLGIRCSDEAEELNERIAEKMLEQEKLRTLRDEIEQSTTVEHALAIIDEAEKSTSTPSNPMEPYIKNRDVSPDFNLPELN